MKKKIVILSIFLVSILVLVTYSSAVGIQSKESSTMQSVGSPLFTIRINNAINTDTPKLISNYIGKGENTLDMFPMKLFIDKINKNLDTQVIQTIIWGCFTSGCDTAPPCGPTDNGPFCGFTENGPICDIKIINNELAFPLLK